MYHALYAEVRSAQSLDWQRCYDSLFPGAHAAVVVYGTEASQVYIELRKVGFEVRDSLSIPYGKHSYGMCMLFRKPCMEGTVAGQVLLTKTGAVNIDRCRIKHASKEDFEAHKAMVDTLKAKGGSLGNSWKNSSDLANANEVRTDGRWPPNMLLIHAPGCVHVGSKRVEAPVINRFADGMKPFGNGAGHAYSSTQTGDADGMEEVPVYSCVDDCPVPALDDQTGVLTSGTMKAGQKRVKSKGKGGYHDRFPDEATSGGNHGDSGGASRFFPQFESGGAAREWLISLILPPGGALLELSNP